MRATTTYRVAAITGVKASGALLLVYPSGFTPTQLYPRLGVCRAREHSAEGVQCEQ